MIADGNGESLDTSRQQELEAGSVAGDCFFLFRENGKEVLILMHVWSVSSYLTPALNYFSKPTKLARSKHPQIVLFRKNTMWPT